MALLSPLLLIGFGLFFAVAGLVIGPIVLSVFVPVSVASVAFIMCGGVVSLLANTIKDQDRRLRELESRLNGERP
jgi:hypothetical protein